MADITWRTTQFPLAYIGQPYEASLAETGSLTAVTACTVASGALPAGLAISADFVRITGTPTGPAHTAVGTYTFTLTMTDTAGGVTSGSFTITVAAGDHIDGQPVNTLPLAAQLAKEWS